MSLSDKVGNEVNIAFEKLKRDLGGIQMDLNELLIAQTERRLIILPCKLYSRVYEIQDRWFARSGCYGCLNNNDLGSVCSYWDEVAQKCTNLTGMYGDKKIISVGFGYHHIPHFGKIVFLTREEAESALAAQEER